MDSIQKILQAASRVLKENLLLYDVYSHMESHIGIKKILNHLIGNARETLHQLQEFEEDTEFLSLRFSLPCGDAQDLNRLESPFYLDGYTSFQDTLKKILERESLLVEFLEMLLSCAESEETAGILRSRLDQTRRHRALIQDRLDLETMLST